MSTSKLSIPCVPHSLPAQDCEGGEERRKQMEGEGRERGKEKKARGGKEIGETAHQIPPLQSPLKSKKFPCKRFLGGAESMPSLLPVLFGA